MRTLYHPDTHNTDLPADSYWAASAGPAPAGWKKMNGDESCDVAIIGAGYTGLSAALHLARLGVDVRVVDAGPPGGGASGRNGGFCCVGAVKLSDKAMIRRFGLEEARQFYASQREAVDLVRSLIDDNGMHVDVQGDGMLEVAHRPSRVAGMKAAAAFSSDTLDLPTRFLEREELVEHGFAGREAHGGLHFADGFGLHPLKYLYGLLDAVLREGVPVHPRTRVIGWKRVGHKHRLITRAGSVHAGQVLIATNGYTEDALHPALAGTALPV
ncbi:MAG: FAD-binding oxidoreductase, partial [Inquilinus sp.]|nr:FAD-binding oxidoreductase [Inquilinus sp.]